MDALALKADLESRGMCLVLAEGGLQISPSSAITPEHRALIRTHKDELVALVKASDRRTQEFVQLLERAGCGPEHPDHAEGLALALVFPGALETLRQTLPAKGAA